MAEVGYCQVQSSVTLRILTLLWALLSRYVSLSWALVAVYSAYLELRRINIIRNLLTVETPCIYSIHLVVTKKKRKKETPKALIFYIVIYWCNFVLVGLQLSLIKKWHSQFCNQTFMGTVITRDSEILASFEYQLLHQRWVLS